MRSLRLLCVGSALLLLAACGGSSPSTARSSDPLQSGSPAADSPSPAAEPPASPASEPTAAASPTTVRRSTAPAPSRTPAASAKATPRPSARPSPKPSPKPSPTVKTGPTHALEMTPGYRFAPMSLTIGVGDAVRAHNGDTITHTFTGPSWDSGDVSPGTYAKVFRFNTAGRFNFFCSPHQGLGMTGTLTVQ